MLLLLVAASERVDLNSSNLTYPGYHPGPKIWLDVIVGLVETAQDYLALIDTKPADEKKLLSDAEVLGDQAYTLLSLISGADASQIPHQIVDPFQRWAAALKIDNTIFFRAEHVSNYELATIDCRAMAQNLQLAKRKPSPVY